MSILGDGEAHLVGSELGPLGAPDVAPDGEAREIAHRTPRDEGAARARGHTRLVGEELERLVLQHHGARGLEPTRTVQSRARHHHVEKK